MTETLTYQQYKGIVEAHAQALLDAMAVVATGGLEQEIEKNDLEKKMSDAEDWAFADFVKYMTCPYWKLKLKDVLARGELALLLKDTPEF